MVHVEFVSADGSTTSLAIPAGVSLMRAAVDGGVAGILGECGGACRGATCHQDGDGVSRARVPGPGELEAEMLELPAADRLPGSRLSCQLIASEAFDGMVVHVPVVQR